MYDPEKDGIDHINVYSKGKTRLGRLLSNFSHTLVDLHPWGKFESIEGFWYWLNVSIDHPERGVLRTLWGYQAKKMGRKLRGKDWDECSGFRSNIQNAIYAKILQHSEILQLLVESTLPLTHYYVFNGKVFVPKSGEWIIDWIEHIRSIYQQEANVR